MSHFADKDFGWLPRNIELATKHGLTIEEIEYVIRNAAHGYPRHHRKGTWLVIGQTPSGLWVEGVFFVDDAGRIRVIHAMPLLSKKQRRKRRR